MEELILLKLGGSLITDKAKPFTERADVIQRLSLEIKQALDDKNFKLIVGHGGGSYPHVPAQEYSTRLDSPKGIAAIQDAASRLNRIVVKHLIAAGVDAVSIQPSASCVCKNRLIERWSLGGVEHFLEKGIVPVPYGDVVADTVQGATILSTEEVFVHFARHLDYRMRIVSAGIVDGVLKDTLSKEVVPELTRKNVGSVNLGGSAGIDVTGGMAQKVEKLLEIAKVGVSSQIVNGIKEGVVAAALRGEKTEGTVLK